MVTQIAVVAPHPDDETLGCGGTILRHRYEGDEVHWIIATEMSADLGFSEERMSKRQREIERVASHYGFASISFLGFPTTRLSEAMMGEIVEKLGSALCKIAPNIVYMPSVGDVHTDHKIVCEAVVSCSKWFRNSAIRKVLSYETLSETDFDIAAGMSCFRPTVFKDIGSFLQKKIEIFKEYEGESGMFPFPRCEEAILALARIRGIAAGFSAAEAFQLLKEID